MSLHPGVGEVTGAIILTASFGIAAATLFAVFQERMDAAQWETGIHTDMSMMQAAELVHAGPAHCGYGFLVHNYSPHPLNLHDMTVYAGRNGTIYAAAASYADLAGGNLTILDGGRSAWVATDAACPLVLVTPAGIRITVGT